MKEGNRYLHLLLYDVIQLFDSYRYNSCAEKCDLLYSNCLHNVVFSVNLSLMIPIGC